MRRSLLSAAAYLVGNGIGLLAAIVLLPGFSTGIVSFVVAVLIFSVVQALVGPLVRGASRKWAPQLMGGIALVVIFLGLGITGVLVSGMTIGGISNWLAATLLVWLGSLAADILLPHYVFKELKAPADRPRAG